MAFFQAKVPAALASGLICLFVGGGLGAAIVGYSQAKPEQAEAAPAEEDGKGANSKGPNDKGGKGGKGNKKGMGGMGGGGQRGPSAKAQLGQLVQKLDVLTKQSLHVELTPDQKKQVKEALAGLGAKREVSDDEAKAKLDALLKALEGQRETLTEAGYRWPSGGAPGGGGGAPTRSPTETPPFPPTPPAPPQNPFAGGDGAKHLKSLEATLSK
jgi:hypothetical protein